MHRRSGSYLNITLWVCNLKQMYKNYIEFIYRKRKMMTGLGDCVHEGKTYVIYPGEEKPEGRQN